MTVCAMFGCKNRMHKGSGKHFFRFPLKDPERLARWIEVVQRDDWKPTVHSKVCSDHFTEKDYMIRPGAACPYLRTDAVPTPVFTQRKKKTKKRYNKKSASDAPAADKAEVVILVDDAQTENQNQQMEDMVIQDAGTPSKEPPQQGHTPLSDPQSNEKAAATQDKLHMVPEIQTEGGQPAAEKQSQEQNEACCPTTAEEPGTKWVHQPPSNRMAEIDVSITTQNERQVALILAELEDTHCEMRAAEARAAREAASYDHQVSLADGATSNYNQVQVDSMANGATGNENQFQGLGIGATSNDEQVASGSLADGASNGHSLADVATHGDGLADGATSGHGLADGATSGHGLADGATSGDGLADGATSGDGLADGTTSNKKQFPDDRQADGSTANDSQFQVVRLAEGATCRDSQSPCDSLADGSISSDNQCSNDNLTDHIPFDHAYTPLTMSDKENNLEALPPSSSPSLCPVMNPKIVQLRKKIKTIQKRVLRQSMKIKGLKQTLGELRRNNLTDKDPERLISEHCSGLALALFTTQLKSHRKYSSMQYCEPLKDFSMNLYQASPKAYKFCRLFLSLPHPVSLRHWRTMLETKEGEGREVVLQSEGVQGDLSQEDILAGALEAVALESEASREESLHNEVLEGPQTQ